MIANRYATFDLYIPTELHPTVRDACGSNKAFPRQVDAWWLGLCIGVQLGRKTPTTSADRGVKFNDGAILGTDPWRITHLELLALAEEGDDVLQHPSRVLAIASAYANEGLKWLVDNCLIGSVQPIITIANKVQVGQLEAQRNGAG